MLMTHPAEALFWGKHAGGSGGLHGCRGGWGRGGDHGGLLRPFLESGLGQPHLGGARFEHGCLSAKVHLRIVQRKRKTWSYENLLNCYVEEKLICLCIHCSAADQSWWADSSNTDCQYRLTEGCSILTQHTTVFASRKHCAKYEHMIFH